MALPLGLAEEKGGGGGALFVASVPAAILPHVDSERSSNFRQLSKVLACAAGLALFSGEGGAARTAAGPRRLLPAPLRTVVRGHRQLPYRAARAFGPCSPRCPSSPFANSGRGRGEESSQSHLLTRMRTALPYRAYRRLVPQRGALGRDRPVVDDSAQRGISWSGLNPLDPPARGRGATSLPRLQMRLLR